MVIPLGIPLVWVPFAGSHITHQMKWNPQGVLASVAHEDVKQNGFRALLVGICSLSEVNQDRNTQPKEVRT